MKLVLTTIEMTTSNETSNEVELTSPVLETIIQEIRSKLSELPDLNLEKNVDVIVYYRK